MENLKAMYERLARIHSQMNDRARDWKALPEGQEIDKEEERQFDEWAKEYDELEAQIKRFEKLDSITKDDRKEDEPEKPERKDYKEEYKEVFRNYILNGAKGLTPDEYKVLAAHKVDERAATASSTTTTAGGYGIPEDFSYEIELFMKYMGPFGMAAPNAPFREWVSDTGADLPWPVIDDTSNDGYLLAESGDATTSATGVTWGVETLKAYAHNSGVIPVTYQIIQDNAFNFPTLLAELLGNRLGRIMNTQCTTGDGSSKPEGVTIGSQSGKVAVSATAFTGQELIDLKYSVNKAYRVGPKVGFMMHSQTVGYIRKLDYSTANVSQSLWQPSFAQDVPSTILGHQYWENDDMASTLATGAIMVLFGDFSKFVVRKVRGIELLRSDERYFEKLQAAFLAWNRFDSRVVNADAIKYLDLT